MKKLLTISNEPFAADSANGRTLMNLLLEYDKDSIAQFYIHGHPDVSFCQRYFRISDRDALNAFLGRKKKKSNSIIQQNGAVTNHKKRIRRNCRNLLLRNLVWTSFAWWRPEFEKFLIDFSPEVVLLQGGDAPFMFAIAREIAKKFCIPLVLYNSENYVLKQYLYNGAKQDGIWHTLLQRCLRNQYDKFMKRVDFCIYSMEQLEKDYQQAYPHPGKSATLYTVSDLKPEVEIEREQADPFSLVYCGNLGVGRAEPMAELADALYESVPSAKLEVYGRFVTEREQKLVCEKPNVVYHGVVDYSEVPGILGRADMIVHCENRARLENLRTAFSTKIADSLAVGTPFLVFADKNYPFVQYLERNHCAHIAQSKEELKEILKKCHQDVGFRYQHVKNAVETAERNHSADNNCRKFNEIIQQVCDKVVRAE